MILNYSTTPAGLKMGFTLPFVEYINITLNLRVLLPGDIVSMVTYCVTKMTATRSPMIGWFYIVASTDMMKSAYNDLSKSQSWKVLETVDTP